MRNFITKWFMGFNYENNPFRIKIYRWHPFIWFVFLMDLILGPLVVLLCPTYTWSWYVYELKAILRGEY